MFKKWLMIFFGLSLVCLLLTVYWTLVVIPSLSVVHTDKHKHANILPRIDLVQASKYRKDSNNSNKNDLELKAGGNEIAKRVERLKNLCKKFHLGKYKWSNSSNDLNIKEPPTPLYSYFFWNRGKKLAWCPVYKAGSTSWLKNMMRLAGISEEAVQNPMKQLSVWAREVYGDADNFDGTEFQKSLKLLVVRHPFERLLSAYRDKLANSTYGHEHGTHHFYLKYGKRIVQKFRVDSTIQQKEPTWEEFVRYILKTDLIQYADDHWLPAYYSCTPCLVDYNIIGKTETYYRDQQIIIRKAGLETVLKPRWSHSTVNDKFQSRSWITQHFFSQLKKSQVQQLYEKYKLDFLLFGYSHLEYVQLAH